MIAKIFRSRRSKAKLLYYIDCLFFKNRNKILFVVKNRTYLSGNLRVVLETYYKRKLDKEKIYVYKDGKCSDAIKEELLSINVVVLEGFGFYSLWHILTAGTIILSHNPRDAHISKKCKNRTIINLWHGVAIKNIELIMPNIEDEKLSHLKTNSILYDLVIASSKADKKTNKKAFGVDEDKVKITGLPRYMLLSDNYTLTNTLKEEENKIKSIKGKKKLVLYAPTFRENGKSAIEQITTNEWKLLEEFSRIHDIIFGIRPHPYDIQHLPDIIKNSSNFYIFKTSDFTEPNIILRHTDVLIVDYSSIWVDYLLLNRPIIGFAKDYNEYIKNERGFCYEFNTVFPSEFLSSIKTLTEVIGAKINSNSICEYKNITDIFHEHDINFDYATKIFEEIERLRTLKLNYSTSYDLIKSAENFIKIKKYYYVNDIFNKKGIFYGWGRKKSGQKAVKIAKKHQTSFILLEDGFIRSIGLGVEGSPSFSIVEDDIGIYYDATVPSKLENILNTHDFASDTKLMDDAAKAMALIRKHHISKYNNAPLVDENFLARYGMDSANEKRILIIAQTAGDASLEYGLAGQFSTTEMITSALQENPGHKLYLKIHPDVLSGKKASDIDIAYAKKHCTIIEENVNPISLLKHFTKVYTKTSGMGFEALIVGCECVCFGMPYYAGWGVTTDKVRCPRRTRQRSVEEIFAAAYILYSRYYNPYRHRDSDIFDTIEEIVKQRQAIGLL